MLNKNADLSICIVNWNTRDSLVEALESILRHTDDIQLEIIVVDNASSDGSANMIEQKFPEVILIRNEKNLGFGRAHNLAFQRITGKCVLVLNSDVIVTENSLQRMICFMEAHPEFGAVSCRLVNPDGNTQESWFDKFPTLISEASWAFLLYRILRHKDSHQVQEDRPVAYVAGACMLVRRLVLQRLYGFDPQYYMYGEDMDLCYRIRCMNLGVFYMGSVSVMHYHGASSSKQKRSYFAFVMQKESRYRFMLSHRGVFSAILYRVIWMNGGIVRTVLWTLVLVAFTPLGNKNKIGTICQQLSKSAHITLWALGIERWSRQ